MDRVVAAGGAAASRVDHRMQRVLSSFALPPFVHFLGRDCRKATHDFFATKVQEIANSIHARSRGASPRGERQGDHRLATARYGRLCIYVEAPYRPTVLRSDDELNLAPCSLKVTKCHMIKFLAKETKDLFGLRAKVLLVR